jgi:O-acetyl-ADP-ribose deacetylase (regulator of RNase III)
MITYLNGDATCPQANGPKIIAHICNDKGKWGRGFVLALSKRWLGPEQQYRRWFHSSARLTLGDIQLVQVAPDIWVANMVAQSGLASGSNPHPLQYDALAQCLEKLAVEVEARQASVHMPRIGTGLGGGNWTSVERLILKALSCSVVVYDL